jgi:hypothetical protein
MVGAHSEEGSLPELDDARRLYADLMNEARWRL